MIIPPEMIFEREDIERARRLNTCLHLLPRFRPAGRMIPAAINAGLRVRGIIPSPARRTGGVRFSKRKVRLGGGTITLRCIFPLGPPAALYLYYHGGAWVTLDARSSERLVIPLVCERNCAVVLPAFHRATDDRVDLAFADARAALDAAVQMCREEAIASLVVGGESSGAHLGLAAVMDLKMAAGEAPISGFLALCGAFDITGSPTLTAAGKDTLVVDAASAKANLDRLFCGGSVDARLAPLESDLSRMPPCLLIGGALDAILGDTAELYSRWQDQSNNAGMLIVPEAPHGFHWLPTRLASKAIDFAHDWVASREIGSEKR